MNTTRLRELEGKAWEGGEGLNGKGGDYWNAEGSGNHSGWVESLEE